MFFLVFMGVGIGERQRRRQAAEAEVEFGVLPPQAVATAEPAAPRIVKDYDFVDPDEAGPARRA
jgi:hypothetical protein